MSHRVLVALGNRLRQDDGVGPVILDRLSARGLPADVEPIWMEHMTEQLSMLAPSLESVMIVDALAVDAEPGSVIRLPLVRLGYQPAYDLHQLSPIELIHPQLHRRTCCLGVVPLRLGYGVGLSQPVVEGAARAVEYLYRWAWNLET